jgi:hypothetical protein
MLPAAGPRRPERRPPAHVHPLPRHLVLLALALLLAAASTLGGSPARAAVMVPPTGERPKDFALVKKDGVYHLFYIRHNDLLPPWATEVDFGHAISTDLYRWTNLPPVLGIDPSGWDNEHVWAPSVVQWNGFWWMFYTGVSDFPGQLNGTQRIGVAVSSDLMTWNRASGQPIWSNASAPSWAWWAPQNAGMACRDPFVMPDPNAPGQWLMYYTASPASDSLATVVAVARSTGQPDEWTDVKPLWITHRSMTFNQLTESPHLFVHNGRWFMFITSNAGQPLTFFTSSDPIGDPPAWTYRGRLRNMLGYDTANWYASESMRDGDLDLLAFVASDRIEFHTITWGTGDNFALGEPLFFHVVSMGWTKPAVREFEYIGLKLKVSNGVAYHPPLVAWTKGPGNVDVPVSMASLGIPDMPDLSRDSTMIAWYTRWPAALPAGQGMELRVATSDGTASTGWLTIYPNPITPPARGPDLGSLPENPDAPDAPDSSHGPAEPPPIPVDTSAALSPLHDRGPTAVSLSVGLGSPLGGAPAIVFELPHALQARVEMFDVQGRKLVTLVDGALAAGAHALAWDGRDAGGVRAARGLYFVRLTTSVGVATTRFVLDR